MGVVVAALDPALTDALIRRLVAAGDEVRVVEPDAARAERYRGLGAYLAFGDPTDADLLARAATGARTLVVGAHAATAAVEAASGARLVVWGVLADAQRDAVVASGAEHVLLRGRLAGKVLRRRGLSPAAVAVAVDAADDLAGEVRTELDLTDPAAWAALGLRPRP